MYTNKFVRTMLFLLLLVVIVGVLLAIASSVGAQETSGAGRGVIIEATSIEPANPGWCSGPGCTRFSRLTLPTLFGVDPATQVIVPADDSNMGLVLDPPPQPAAEQTYHLRDDLVWSDGTPITAYDVLYNLILDYAYVYEQSLEGISVVRGARIEDDYSITLAYPGPDCVSQLRTNTYIADVRTMAPNFSDFVQDVQAEDTGVLTLKDWADAYREWNRGISLHYPSSPDMVLTSSGGFQIRDPYRPDEVRLSHDDLAYVMRPEFNPPNMVDRFLAGETNVMVNIPFEERADLRATSGIQVYEQPGYGLDYLLFNLSDPSYPRDAFVDGEPLEQLPHPILADVRVRRAVQLALDPQAMVDVALAGSGMVTGSVFPPGSWAYSPAANTYDPAQAKRLLDEAGWRDIDGDHIRECYHCQSGREGSTLSFNFAIEDGAGRYLVADIIRVQLRRVGIGVNITGDNGSGQQFDILLTGAGLDGGLRQRDPDLIRLAFTPEWDTTNMPSGSYNNPRLDEVLQAARTVPTCAIDERAALYQEAQAILLEDVPAVWLYAPDDMYVARDIDGFAPYPGDPFWNVFSWVVIP